MCDHVIFCHFTLVRCGFTAFSKILLAAFLVQVWCGEKNTPKTHLPTEMHRKRSFWVACPVKNTLQTQEKTVLLPCFLLRMSVKVPLCAELSVVPFNLSSMCMHLASTIHMGTICDFVAHNWKTNGAERHRCWAASTHKSTLCNTQCELALMYFYLQLVQLPDYN